MARKHVAIAIAPATTTTSNLQRQDHQYYHHHHHHHQQQPHYSSQGSASPHQSASSLSIHSSSTGIAHPNLNISSPPASMAIPGARHNLPPPRALPPPTLINHVNNPTGNDLGWMWANLDSDMKPESSSSSRPVSPRSSELGERRDYQSRIAEEDFRRRKSSTSTAASYRTPSVSEGYDRDRDSITSPSGHPAEVMLTSHRQSISHAYDDMLKRKIDSGTPGRPLSSKAYDLPGRGVSSRDNPSHKPLTLRSLSLQERGGPSSPRKLSSSNNPHWDPESSSSLLASPSITSRQSYFSDTTRASPAATDVFSAASSVSSYASSAPQSKPANDNNFGRIQGPPTRSSRESGLSSMMAQSRNPSLSNSNPSPSHYPKYSQSANKHGSGAESYLGFNGFNKRDGQDEKSESTFRNLRPHHLQGEVVNLQQQTHHSDYSHNPSYHSHRGNMKRKGAPDSSERDGPPSQQVQQDGRRSPNPVAMPYASPSSNNSYPAIQHTSSTDRLSPSNNPFPDNGHDRNSPYSTQIAIDPVLNPSSHSYPMDTQQLAAQAAQSVKVENLAPTEDKVISPMPGQTAHVCECCPKKPKRFNTEAELSRHMNEKQYVCSYCHNRFKNKNEMERHQMSLHLRDRSWSCAALERNFEAAFHPSTAIPPNNPGHAQQQMPPAPAATDVCGYCGQLFPNPPDYLARGDHLTNVHKFAECNQSKKFWRADHFRQHLKHSHGGIPGKWTNMLEQACLKMEISPLPQAHHSDEGNHIAQQQAAHAARVAQAAAEQASQAVQQQQAQQQAQHSHHHLPHHSQHHSHPSHHDPHHLPPLTPYQASQLQNATASNGSGGMGDSRRGPYPAIQTSQYSGSVVGDGRTE